MFTSFVGDVVQRGEVMPQIVAGNALIRRVPRAHADVGTWRDARFEPVEVLSERPIFGTVPPVTTKVRVPGNALALGGWRGQMEIFGDVLRVVGEDPTNRLEIDCAQVKRCSFNSNNGLWAFRMKDGKKLYLQTSGLILSADRSEAGRAATESIAGLLAKHGVRGFSV